MISGKQLGQLVLSVCPEVTWKPDEAADKCNCCGSFFNIMVRRHHCRFCGEVVCGSCSSTKSGVMSTDGRKDLRCCKVCVKKAQEAISANDESGAPIKPVGQGLAFLPQFKIVIVGDHGVGKSSLLKAYTEPDRPFDQKYRATIGADYIIHEAKRKQVKSIERLWDTPGDLSWQTLGSAYFRGADACIVCYDSTSKKSFQHINFWLNQFKNESGSESGDEGPAIVALVSARGDLTSLQQVPGETGRRFCTSNSFAGLTSVGFFETSAKTGDNVQELFAAVGEAILKKANLL